MMRRIAHFACVAAAFAVLTGCNDKKKDMDAEPQQASADYYDAYGTSDSLTYQEPSSDYYASDAALTGSSAASTTSNAPVAAPTGQRHVVAKGDTLIRLARLYYNDQARWKEIYEANSQTLSNPNQLRVGQELVIP